MAFALLLEDESEDFDGEEPLELESLDDDFDSLEEDEALSLFFELSFSFISRERFFVP